MRNARIALAGAIVCIVCMGNAHAAAFFRLFGTVSIAGPIEPGDYDKLKAVFDARPDADIIIRSPGGNSLEAIHMGELILAHGSSLTVSGYCASACASFLFVAARKRTIRKSAFVAFHAGTEGWLGAAIPEMKAYKATTDAEQKVLNANVDVMTRSYRQILQAGNALQAASGASPLLHDGVLLLTAPKHVSVGIDERTRFINVQVDSVGACDEWVPSPDELAQIGIEVTMQDKSIDRDRVAREMGEPKGRIYFGRLSDVHADGAGSAPCAPPAMAATKGARR